MIIAFIHTHALLNPKGQNRRSICATPHSAVMNTKLERPALVFVTPDHFSHNIHKATHLSKSLIQGGISLIQIRDRKASKEDLKRVTNALLQAEIPSNKLVLNGLSPQEITQLSAHIGIHIKEKDIQSILPEAKICMSSSSLIGCAVHSPHVAKQVMQIHPVDYLQVGTMFETQSHPGKIPEGPQLISQIRSVVGSSPRLIGIGGIDENNIPQVMTNSADGVAVITVLATANDPIEKTRQLLSVCEKSSKDNVQ